MFPSPENQTASPGEGITRSEIDPICHALLEGRDVILSGERGLGKTTVLHMVATTLKDHGRNPTYLRLLDFLGSQNPEDALALLVKDAMRAQPQAVLLIDEVDALPEGLIGPIGDAINSARRQTPTAFAGTDTSALHRIASGRTHGTENDPLSVPLSRLSHADLSTCLLAELDDTGQLVEPVLDELVDLADGHPYTAKLLVYHLMQLLKEGHSVDRAWAATRDLVLRDAGESFRQLWASRTNEIDRRVLRALATGSRSLFAAGTLQEFGLTKSSASRARDRLIHAGLIRRGSDGDYRLADPLFAFWLDTGQRSDDATRLPRRIDKPVRPDPFGSPDASRAELAELHDDFVPVAFNRLGETPSKIEARARVIVGRKGSGKTLYLRRLQEIAARDPSMYADRISANPPPTSDVMRVGEMYPAALLIEAWMSLWRAAILRSAASHLLYAAALRSHIDDCRFALDDAYQAVGGRSNLPLPVGVELRDVIFAHPARATLDRYLADPRWGVLEHYVGEALRQAPPISFYLDGLDEEFRHAPRHWLACQKGLFLQVMRQLRDPLLGARLRVVIGIRDVVYTSVLETEHATRYRATAHIQVLNWSEQLIQQFLEAKIQRLPSELLMKPALQSPVAAWLGREAIFNPVRRTNENLVAYLVRHTRLLPRDVIIIGNELSRAVGEAKAHGSEISETQIRDLVARSARVFGREQISIAANQIAADMMPAGATWFGLSEVHIGNDEGASAYGSAVESSLLETLRQTQTDRFPAKVLRSLGEEFCRAFGEQIDVPSILWQNGILGYVAHDGSAIFREAVETEETRLPRTWETYVLHPTIVDVVGIPMRGLSGNGPQRRLR
jgi:hypothetical protein